MGQPPTPRLEGVRSPASTRTEIAYLRVTAAKAEPRLIRTKSAVWRISPAVDHYFRSCRPRHGVTGRRGLRLGSATDCAHPGKQAVCVPTVPVTHLQYRHVGFGGQGGQAAAPNGRSGTNEKAY